MSEVREPKEKRAIKKKNDIIEKGFNLLCERGYHNITCVDIAKEAGVSTGIIYQYFKDKRDIFLEGVKNYSGKLLFPVIDASKKEIDRDNLDKFVEDIIDEFINTHTMSKKAHNELMAMECLDSEVADIFREYEILMTKNIADILKKQNVNVDNMEEKIHIIIGLVDKLCHEVVYHHHEELDINIMKKEVINLIVYLLKT